MVGIVVKKIMGPFAAQADFLKDSLQVALLTYAVGGTSFVIGNPHTFSSAVSKISAIQNSFDKRNINFLSNRIRRFN